MKYFAHFRFTIPSIISHLNFMLQYLPQFFIFTLFMVMDFNSIQSATDHKIQETLVHFIIIIIGLVFSTFSQTIILAAQ